jgi:predicted permease
MNVLPLQDVDSAGLRDRILIIWAAVGVVLLIGCVNVASLMLARGATRGRELATRIALGGGAGSLVRQLTVEAIVLGLMGGAAGLALGYFAILAFQSAAPQFGVWQQVRLDARVLGSAIGVPVLTGVLFGLAPALQATRVDVRTALVEGSSRGVAGGRSHLLRRILVVAEVALGLALVTSAGLLVRTLLRLQNLPPGFDGSNVLSASVSLQDARYRSALSVNRLYRQTLERLRQTPGVESAAVGLHIPYQRWFQAGVDILGAADSESPRRSMAAMNYVTSDYFHVLHIPLRAGRPIEERDSEKSPPVVVINEAFARQYLRGQQPLGAHIRMRTDSAEREIVGVAGDTRNRPGFAGGGPLDYIPSVFVPATQLPDKNFQLIHTWFSPSWLVRGSEGVSKLSQAVEQAVEAADPLLPVASFRTVEAEKGRALGSQRINALLLGSLAGLALILSAVGIYGLAANSVVERTRELGIRMALGATTRSAMWTAMKPGMLLSLVGVFAGAGLSILTTGLIKSSLYGVTALDPVTFAVAAAILSGVGLFASLIPALRLLWLNPACTLRQE